MKRGYARQIKGRKEADQLAALNAAGVTVIYSSDDLEGAVASLRNGDDLVVAGGLHLLASNRRAIREVVDAVHEQGAVVYDLESERSTAGFGVAMMDDAIIGLSNEVRLGNVRDAGKLGAKRRWAETQIKRMDDNEARVIWEDTRLTMPEALAKMTGWNRSTAYRRFGAPDRGAGRKKGSTAAKPKRGKGRVYFLQNPETKRIRIGYSTKPMSRLRQHQGAHDVDLDFLLVIDGTPRLEKKLHEQFKPYRKRGSWYEPSEELMNFITAKAEEK